ncbi:MAG: thioredoxin family protein [Myxococcota bacterium]
MNPAPAAPTLPSGLVAFVKRDCPTCELIAPVLGQIAEHRSLTVYSQDDPGFPDPVSESLTVVDDRELAVSWHHNIETVPTLIQVADGREQKRLVGWQRGEWESFTGLSDLGTGLREYSPGCGSLSVAPDRAPALAARYGSAQLRARRVTLAALEDEMEAMFARGWSDGLPVVPPTEARVLAMLDGTSRAPDEVVATVPPDLVECTVEKIAINAVMAGCKPEYLPVVIAATEAVCTDAFNMHGLLATTMPVGPVLVVNGPIRRRIGMNAGRNVFGQGNRANSTIGRAVQLIVRNVGGGRPGEIDCAAHGNPGKVGFCFAELEEDSPWQPLSVSRGIASDTDAVTVFAGEGPRCIIDQLSRDADSLARSLAHNLRALYHTKLVLAFDAILAIGPEHARIFRQDGWDRRTLQSRLFELLQIPGEELARGADGIAEGMPEGGDGKLIGLPPKLSGFTLPKFKPGGLHIVHCGGGAGLFSMVIGGWVSGSLGSQIVTREITP